jgi:hypothetical protein
MSAFMVLAVADGCELLVTVLAEVRFLTGVGPHVYQEVAFLCKNLSAVGNSTFEEVLS